MIDEKTFETCVGSKPIDDDLERCNCDLQGEIGHRMDKPRKGKDG